MRDTIGYSIARALGGRKVGDGWMARCPAHDDREPSLSLRQADDGRVLVYCHAGCGQERVIAALNSRGLWKDNNPIRENCSAQHKDARNRLDDDAKRSDAAQQAIHRTFLAGDGSGKAPVDPQKMMLGPCRGGAVRLAPVGDVMMVGEGIETCLAAMQATGMPAWAALSTSGLLALVLPDIVRDVIVLADGDDAGEAAAQDAALRWKREGRRVRIARPPHGLDFNDMLLGRAPSIEGGVQ